jgi:hypothetical protein
MKKCLYLEKLLENWILYLFVNCCYDFIVTTRSEALSKNLMIKIHKITILSFVSYGCETWLLTLGKEQRLGLFEGRVVGRIFWRKGDVVKGAWEKYMTRSFIIWTLQRLLIRQKRWTYYVARIREMTNAHNILVGKPQTKRSFRRGRPRWPNNIKMNQDGAGRRVWTGFS